MSLAVPVDTVYTVAQSLLVAAEQVLIDNGLSVPDHKFVSWHYPSWDCCNHLVVHFKRIAPTRASMRSQEAHNNTQMILEADLVLTLIGCATVGDPIPSDADIAANALIMYSQAWTLYQGLICDWVPALPAEYGEGCHVVKVGDLQPHPPQGGCESIEITFTVQFA